MNENKVSLMSKGSNKRLSLDAKKNYCIAWKKSGMSQIDFCKTNGISKSALYQWNKEFEMGNKETIFSAAVSKNEIEDTKSSGMIQLNIDCPNHIRLSISIPEYRLLTFIQEIGYATSTIW